MSDQNEIALIPTQEESAPAAQNLMEDIFDEEMPEGKEESEDLFEGIVESETKEGEAPAVEVEKPEAEAEGEKPAEEEIDTTKIEMSEEEINAKVEELTTKAEEGDLTAQEIAFLKDNGYDVEIEGEEGEEAPAAEGEAKEGEEGEEPAAEHTTKYDDYLAKTVPGMKFETREAKETHILERLEKEDEANARIKAVFEAHPETVETLVWLEQNQDKNVTLIDAIMATTGIDDIETLKPKPGEEGYDAYIIKANQAKEDKIKQKERLEAQQGNYVKSVQSVNNVIANKKLSKEQGEALFKEIDKDIAEFSNAIWSERYIESKLKGLNYDIAVQAARATGETEGLNKRIVIKRKTRKAGKVPNLVSGGTAGKEENQEEVDKWLNEATAKGKSKW